MKIFTRFNSIGILGVLAIGAVLQFQSQNAFAKLNCISDWEVNEGKAHCHIVVMQEGCDELAKVCTRYEKTLDHKTQPACEAFCNDQDGQLQVRLEKLLMKSAQAAADMAPRLEDSINKILEARKLAQEACKVRDAACAKANFLEGLLTQINAGRFHSQLTGVSQLPDQDKPADKQ